MTLKELILEFIQVYNTSTNEEIESWATEKQKEISIELINKVEIPILPCKEASCQNPNEKAYRGCDICKFKKK